MVRLSSYAIVVGLAGAWGCGGASLSEEQGQAGGADGGSSSGNGGSVSGGRGGAGGAGGGGAKGGSANGGTSGSANGGASGSAAAGGSGGTSGSSTGGNGGDAGGVGGVGGGAASGGDAGVSAGGTSGSGLGGAGGSVAGQGGASGTAGGGTCTDSDSASGTTNQAAIRGTTVGDNGSFTDECDANGNLLEHSCEVAPCGLATRVAFPTGGNGGVPCTSTPTGQVAEQVIDCGGLCHDGTCFEWCAVYMDVFEVLAVEGSTLGMTRGSYDYSCTVAFQRDGFDCLSQEMVGRSLVVTSLGNCGGASTTFGWDDPENPLLEECAFTCAALL